jgi:dTMP kinase
VKRAGTFVTLEGVEGVGKSTHMGFIAKQIERSGVRAVMTREPGGTRLGEAVREILLHGQELDIFPETELLLMFAARSQHLEEVILPALAEGSVVICDRFTDASYAYQGGGRKIPESLIQTLEQSVQHDLRPDLTLLFDASVETGLKRAGRRSNADRFEAEDISFFNRVRETYLARAKADPGRIKIIDAEQDIVGVERQILSILESWL